MNVGVGAVLVASGVALRVGLSVMLGISEIVAVPSGVTEPNVEVGGDVKVASGVCVIVAVGEGTNPPTCGRGTNTVMIGARLAVGIGVVPIGVDGVGGVPGVTTVVVAVCVRVGIPGSSVGSLVAGVPWVVVTVAEPVRVGIDVAGGLMVGTGDVSFDRGVGRAVGASRTDNAGAVVAAAMGTSVLVGGRVATSVDAGGGTAVGTSVAVGALTGGGITGGGGANVGEASVT